MIQTLIYIFQSSDPHKAVTSPPKSLYFFFYLTNWLHYYYYVFCSNPYPIPAAVVRGNSNVFLQTLFLLASKAGDINLVGCIKSTLETTKLTYPFHFSPAGEKPHVCAVCNKGFSTSSSLNTHRRIHSGEKPHQCGVCGKRFTASSNLYYHRMTHIKVRD